MANNDSGLKCGKIESAKRHDYLMELLLKGYQRRDILKDATVLSWNITHHRIDAMLPKVLDMFEESVKKERPKLINQTAKQFDYLYLNLIKQKKFKEAVIPLLEKIKLLGLETPKQIELTGKDGEPFNNNAVMPTIIIQNPYLNNDSDNTEPTTV